MNTQLERENKRLQDRVNRLQDENSELRAHIELQRTEIIALQNREEKSGQLKEIFEPPKHRNIKTFEIDNRNHQ